MEQGLAKLDAFKAVLNSAQIRAQVKNSLHENAGAFMSSMIDLYNGDSYLQKCDPQAVAFECLKAASLKLPIVKSLGFAYVVPFKNVPTFVVGYKGLIQLAQRTGEYQTINADVVYEGELAGHNKLSGEIDLDGERKSDKVIGYFAYFRLVSGFEKILYMSHEDIVKWAERYSPSYSSNYSPWKNEFDKMAQKTCLRRLIGTYGPMSIEMQQAFDSDDAGRTPQQEVSQNANKKVLEPDYKEVDPKTGEVKEPGSATEKAPEKEPEPASVIPPAGF